MPKAGQTMKPLVRLPRDPNACWAWLGSVNVSSQCACKTVNGITMPARRWMWETLFGPIGEGLVITNTCGNKTCINPHHLKCCTQADANRSGPQVTLTPHDVKEIRAHKATRLPGTARLLAERYGVSTLTIRDIWRGNSWGRAKPNNGPKHKKAVSA